MRRGSSGRLSAALALILLACAARADEPARLLASFTWRVDDPRFGGFSGLEVTDDGGALVAVSDRGAMLRGRITRQKGAIAGITITDFGPIRLDRPAKPPGLRDTEGLAIAPGGRVFVSLEGMSRVLRLSDKGRATRLPDHPDFAGLAGNAALEVLAIDARGRLYTMPEKSSAWDAPFPVWRFENGQWTTAFHITRSPGFLPVGGDFGYDGAFYLLERGFNGIGFRTRVRRFELTGNRPLSGRIMFTAPVLRHDNLEGLSVWRDGQGRTRLTMISDDNFRRLQRTEIVEYVIGNPLQ
ncbi:esterase-like activity of phytase family protein [Lutimaribacter sp. EGI FJ00015]|uniref:Esterase-like activity of phytase family protein n=1 Tax=Lutimaribacter degradans TaxID=2945989 RepID=A0ACC5ZYZ3_9RHOB|nr:esterase-like activity of phytase family protein [Lutimaribacter sp. EGI FJ00013]MCM2562574.1 esterase-like activity of phytase family protein [Lutimaribacter sp. EGI FJ00013]MCO0613731.1 esterase-like activity of phytase family protein [Lutimaribacter sp. EGI FJ00015]MCO0636786.1 esterase-like activity of phytase family protein [Lutimaribacter sp. EGI FJ00014]